MGILYPLKKRKRHTESETNLEVGAGKSSREKTRKLTKKFNMHNLWEERKKVRVEKRKGGGGDRLTSLQIPEGLL